MVWFRVIKPVLVRILPLLFLLPLAVTRGAPPLRSGFNHRILNRRFVSYILFEVRYGRPCVTILAVHGPNYQAFHAPSAPLHSPCRNRVDCLKKMEKLDRHLRKGLNLGLILEGSWIKKIIYYGPSEQE